MPQEPNSLPFIVGQTIADFVVGYTSISFFLFPPQGFGVPAVRIGDKASDKALASQGSSNVFVNNIAWVRLGDMWNDMSTETTASTRVFVNGMGATRVGDMQSDKSMAVTGSPNVFCG